MQTDYLLQIRKYTPGAMPLRINTLRENGDRMIIKFSHDYDKITGTKEARLLEVLNINLQNLSEDFIKYDTGEIYTLPRKGDYMMLIFQKINSQPYSRRCDLFTTLRRRTDEKEKYYRKAIGRVFQLEKANEAEK